MGPPTRVAAVAQRAQLHDPQHQQYATHRAPAGSTGGAARPTPGGGLAIVRAALLAAMALLSQPLTARPYSVIATYDDAGATASGREQVSLKLALRDALFAGDEFGILAKRDLHLSDGRRGRRVWEAGYAFKAGGWRGKLDAESSDFFFPQSFGGERVNRRGNVRDLKFALKRELFVAERGSFGIDMKIARRFGRCFRSGLELPASYFNHSFLELGVHGTRRFDGARVEAALSRRYGLPILGARRDPIGAQTHRYQMTLIDLTFQTPLRLAGVPLGYKSVVHARLTEQPLLAVEELMLGSRKTVRGYGNDPILTGGKGFYWRNDLDYRLPRMGLVPSFLDNPVLYVGFDYGRIVRGRRGVLGQPAHLAGVAAGVRRKACGERGLDYDVFIAQPLIQPKKCQVAPVSLGVRLSWRH